MDEKSKIDTKDTLMHPLLEDLLAMVPSKYELVLLASLRAKQIIAKQRLGPTFDGQVDADVKAMQSGRKPLSQALHEIACGDLERDRLYLLEYLESFQRGDEDMPQPRPDEEFGFVREPESVPAPPRELKKPATESTGRRGKTKKSEVKTDDDNT